MFVEQFMLYYIIGSYHNNYYCSKITTQSIVTIVLS